MSVVIESKGTPQVVETPTVSASSSRLNQAERGKLRLSSQRVLTELLPIGLLLATILVSFLIELTPVAVPAFAHIVLSSIACAIGLFLLIRTVQHLRFLAELRSILRQISSGERRKRFYFEDAKSAEDRSLALAFSEAQKILARRLKLAEDERRSEESIIASMAEGVLGVDLQERMIRCNPAAAELLNLDTTAVLGRTLHEVLRSSELQKFVIAVLAGAQPEESEILIRGAPERALRVSGRELLSEEGTKTGAIVVLSDITRLRKLERARSDFIANVSHELKTPVTSIQGFAETLLDGALENPEDARKFLGIISRQAARLGEIFDEMLVLSRLEQEEQIELEPTELQPIIHAAVVSCGHRTAAKQTRVEIDCAPTISARCHAPLLEQAIANLVDNAVKYSPAGSRILVTASDSSEGITISVQDNGPGIEPQHLPRIFERFYRVDKGRSRAEGGTGLGLAIVKHIAQAHGGQALVQSSPGQGSTFMIRFKPAPDKDYSDYSNDEGL